MSFYQMGDLQSTVTGYEPVLGDNGLQRTYGVAKTHNDRSQSSLESGLGGGSPSPEEIILSGVLIPLMGDLKGLRRSVHRWMVAGCQFRGEMRHNQRRRHLWRIARKQVGHVHLPVER